ncbi:hypothetical protein [Nigerium massiliense]|nr:hypothetical protein [Nigerium massiliense]
MDATTDGRRRLEQNNRRNALHIINVAHTMYRDWIRDNAVHAAAMDYPRD